MATFIKHVFLSQIQSINLKRFPLYLVTRGTARPPKPKQKRGTIKHRHLIDSKAESLAARGFLRSQKPYTPPSDVNEKLDSILLLVFGRKVEGTHSLSELEVKYTLLKSCFQEFHHSVPNSMLHTIRTVDDVSTFYNTTVSTTTPFDELKTMDLPPNLHVQYEYHRFHPDTDTKFGGVTAYPESSTIVTGLKYKDKYKGHKQKLPDYYNDRTSFIKLE